ncbi:MAG TPA: redoxin domain-containing protein [Candidatus Acidoferrum sp.]|nr:redoxin domain-containing protein [Candidatus Acidoferrum sp.]
MRRDHAASQPSSTGQQSTNAAPQSSKPARQSSSSMQLTGNQRLERREPQRGVSPEVEEGQRSTALPPGTRAPYFNLHTTPDQAVALDDFKGKRLIVAFYPADWSPVCGDELAIFNEVLPEFRKHNAEIVGISVDGVWCHIAYAKYNKLHFSLLSDFEPKGEVARTYGVYRKKDGFSERALFLIDEQGTIRWSYVSPIGVNPGADGILDALEDLENEKSQKGAAA